MENVANQKHYTQHPIQVIEFNQVNSLSWCAANVVKYVCRENLKGGVKDLLKARCYLDCLIQYKQSGKFIPPDKLTKGEQNGKVNKKRS